MKLPKENELLKLEWYDNILRYMENFPFEKYGIDIIIKIEWVNRHHHGVVYVSKRFSEAYWSWDYQFFYNKDDASAIRLVWNKKIVYNNLEYDL